MSAVVTPPRILVVEDDAVTRKFFAAVVRDRMPHAEVVEATDVSTAVQMLGTATGLVITDILLGEGRGDEVLAAVRRANATTYVLAVTGLTGRDAEELVGKGFDAVLTKPVNLADLRAVIDGVFRRPT